jgi:ABC-2 type transport system permease protein
LIFEIFARIEALFFTLLRFETMLQVLAKEFNSFLSSLIAYVVIGVFLTGVGLLMWVFPETAVLDYGYADMDTLFSLGPYVFIFLIPAITMRSFAEERKTGTMELLLTKPLTDTSIIVGKFLACFSLVMLALIPTIIYYWSIYLLGNPTGNIDTPGVIGSYIGLAMLGAVFCAIGIMASSLTSNQIVAFIFSAFLCFLMFSGFDSIATLTGWAEAVLLIKQFGILYHYESLSKGLIDSRDVLYFFSVIFLMLLITRIIVGSRSW